MTISFKIEGLDKLAAKLKGIEDLKFLKAVMRAAGETLKKHIAKYPPASEANSSRGPGNSWYKRGSGSVYEKVGGGVSYYKTSETLGRSWTTAVKDNGLTVEVGNKVTYGPYVQDRDRQTWFHKARGWLTVQEVIEEDSEKIQKQVIDAINKKLEE